MGAVQLEGVVDFIQYPKAFTKSMEWAVLKIKTQQGTVKAKGNIVPCKRGEVFLFEGNFKTSPQWGKEFVFEKAVRSTTGENGAISYLSTLFGPKTAEKIAKHFGSAEEALEEFKRDPYSITVVKGVSAKTVEKGKKRHDEYQVAEVLFTTLKPYGITLHMALKIYKKYDVKAMDKLRENPYRLMSDLDFSFETCDLIAAFFNIPIHHPYRIEAGIFSTMRKSLFEGHTFLLSNVLLERAERVLAKKGNVPSVYIKQTFLDMVNKEVLILEQNQYVYLPSYYKYEKVIAYHLNRLKMQPMKKYQESLILDYVSQFENKNQKFLTGEQKEAVIKAVNYPVSIITGPPGTGKTTVIQAVLFVLDRIKHEVEKKGFIKSGLAAPTGKAARRMSEATNEKALTMHKLLKYRPNQGKWEFEHNAQNPMEQEVFIFDEFSMVDLPLAYHTFQAIPKNARVVVVGDKDQLPSVGAGDILNNLIQAKIFPTTYLTENWRQKQAQGETVLNRAIAISKGIMPDLSNAHDFTFFEHDDLLTLQEEMVRQFYEAARRHGQDEVVILTPMRKTPLGVNELNQIIQETINPAETGKKQVKFGQVIFREGDKVIQTKPNEDFGLVNGQIGYIKEYIPEDDALGTDEQIVVNYDGELAYYTRDRFDELQHAWALTIHKSQGSEWKEVLVPIHDEHFFMLLTQLVYTSWTRHKTHLHIFGEQKTLERAIRMNKKIKPRNSLLVQRVKGLIV
ncbi:MAG: AAA family ATPase [Tepidibacillus sp.]